MSSDTPTSEIEIKRLRRKRRFRGRLLKFILIGGALALVVGIATAAIGYWYFSQDLPQLNRVTDYHPKLITTVYAVDEDNKPAELVGEYFLERRKIVPIDKVPQLLKYAFVSAEDSSFYKHTGIDFMAIFRAAIANIKAGHFVQGGSTITQQVTKSLLLSNAKKISRKIREAILAKRIEKHLTKDEILWLYLNQIYLGHGAYGVQAAAENYFSKDVTDLTLGEMAILAGLPKAPGRDSPILHPQRAQERQRYVLKRMVAEGYITQQQADEAANEKIIIRRRIEPPQAAKWYTEYVRRYLQEKYGDKMLYEEGLKVVTSMRLDLQQAAQKSVVDGLRELDKRQGYRGPLFNVGRKLMQKRQKDLEAKEPTSDYEDDATATTQDEQQPQEEISLTPQEMDSAIAAFRKKTQASLKAEFDRRVFDATHPRPGVEPKPAPEKLQLYPGKIYRGIVTEVDSRNDKVEVAIGDFETVLPLGLMKWAREPDPEVAQEWDPVEDPAEVLEKGDVILARPIIVGDDEKDQDFFQLDEDQQKAAKSAFDKKPVVALEQKPADESALLSYEVDTGYVRAMIGGMDPQASEFNRAVQAKRQPGSAFKPIVYTAALDKGYTPASIIYDTAITGELDGVEDKWKPKNYGGHFGGPTTLHKALTESRNIVSIKILKDIGISYAARYARQFGIESDLNLDLSLALGSSSLSLTELARAFGVFPNGGIRPVMIHIRQIFNRDGELIEDNRYYKEIYAEAVQKLRENPGKPFTMLMGTEPFTISDEQDLEKFEDKLREWMQQRGLVRTVSPQTAYIMTTILRDVVRHGTGWRVKALGRPAGGKTGTTNDQIDTWFMGFTPDIVTGVWVGSDELKPLGRLETGGRTAIPIWLDYMTAATKDRPKAQFERPSGIEFAYIDYDNGLLSTPASLHTAKLAFKQGTAPRQFSTGEGEPEDEGFFRLDMGL